jgi:hypothetical protein
MHVITDRKTCQAARKFSNRTTTVPCVSAPIAVAAGQNILAFGLVE